MTMVMVIQDNGDCDTRQWWLWYLLPVVKNPKISEDIHDVIALDELNFSWKSVKRTLRHRGIPQTIPYVMQAADVTAHPHPAGGRLLETEEVIPTWWWRCTVTWLFVRHDRNHSVLNLNKSTWKLWK